MKTRNHTRRDMLLMSLLGAAIGVAAASGSARAAPAPADAFACPAGLETTAAKALGVSASDAASDTAMSACRLDPGHDDQAIFAMAYVPAARTKADPDGGSLDLVVGTLGIQTGKLVAHRHDTETVDDGGDRFEGIAIDTARYVLGPGQRAFGVTQHHSTHCYCANSSSTDMTLYLPHGDKLDDVADVEIASYQSGTEKGETPPPCTNTSTTEATTVGVGKGTSHGLSDLVLTTVKTETYDDEDPSKCPALKPVKTVKVLQFDGDTYK